MSWLASAIIAGITSFVATNIDDIVILTLFFAQVNTTFRPKHIVIGQYLGFSALVVASLPGFFGGLIVPREWIGILGLLPIGIGISQLVNREKAESGGVNRVGVSPTRPRLFKRDEEVQVVAGELHASRTNLSIVSTLASFLSPQTYNVAAVTVANGGDNIGIYVPLFASNNLASLAVILSIFFLLVGVWCYIAYQLTRQPAIAHVLTRYGQRIVPFVLIGLGIFILIESGTYSILDARF